MHTRDSLAKKGTNWGHSPFHPPTPPWPHLLSFLQTGPPSIRPPPPTLFVVVGCCLFYVDVLTVMWYGSRSACAMLAGALLIGSLPSCDLGKAMTSRMLSVSQTMAISRSSPATERCVIIVHCLQVTHIPPDA